MHFTHIRRRILKIKPQLNLVSVDDNRPVTLIVCIGLLKTSFDFFALEGSFLRVKRPSLTNMVVSAALVLLRSLLTFYENRFAWQLYNKRFFVSTIPFRFDVGRNSNIY